MSILFAWSYLIIPFFIICIALIGRAYAARGIAWYQSIILPPYIPQSWFLSTMWLSIYVLVSIVFIIVWNTMMHTLLFWLIMVLAIMHGILNLGWSYLFFHAHAIGLSVINAIFLQLTLVYFMYLVWWYVPFTVLLMIPYVLWIMSVIFFTFVLWCVN